MSADAREPREGFLERWSRMKTEVRSAPAALPEQTEPARVEEAPPQLPPVEELTIDSDFRDFFHPKVDERVRRSALRKLFSDPHFNVMDGLDVYIDDYSKPDPIPAAMLAGLKQAQRIIEWAREKEEPPGKSVETAPTPEQIQIAMPEEPLAHEAQSLVSDALRDSHPVDDTPPEPSEVR